MTISPLNMNSREGYTDIPDNETKGLLGSQKRESSERSLSKLFAIGLFLIGTIVGSCVVWSLRSGPSETTRSTHSGRSKKKMKQEDFLYRPLCQQHRSNVNVRFVQTSMGQPSQQWADLSCLPEPTVGIFAKPVSVDYAAPDARIQVNFSDVPTGFQPILGFGGAFTEASSLNFHRLSKEGQEAVLQLLFGKDGLGYTIGRIPMNSCDFSVKNYTFDETEDDFDLNDFDMKVTHDQGMIDFATRSQEILKEAWGAAAGDETVPADGELKFFTSPWSPPSWMKKPTWQDPKGSVHAGNMTYSAQGTCLREGVSSQSKYARAWALYFSKFISAYRAQNVSFWAVTVQNEPEFAAPWEACSYTPATQAEFVGNHLGPRLRQDHPGVKLLVFDHNKDHVNTWTTKLLNNNKSAPFVDGIAYHWYAGGMDRLLDGALGNANMHLLQESINKLNQTNTPVILGSEACHCPTTGYAGGNLDVAWTRAERYAHSMIADLMAGSTGWTEWNLVLDSIGGPNHLGNLCETTILSVPNRATNASDRVKPLPDFEVHSPMGDTIIGDDRTREEWNAMGMPAEFLDVGVAVQPLYFYMGHVSRFVRPGSTAVRAMVHSNSSNPIFRPAGAVVAGGGENDLARKGIEITVWPCDGSTRQFFDWNVNDHKHVSVQGHDWLGNPTTSCLANEADEDLQSVRLVDCSSPKSSSAKNVGAYDLVEMTDGDFNIVVTNHPKLDRPCLVVQPLHNGGGAHGHLGGAPVTVGSCDSEAARWKIDQLTGVAKSLFFSSKDDPSEVCMTTGWPFLQVGAFRRQEKKTVVLLNEAKETANFQLFDEHGLAFSASIPPRTIQSIVMD